MKISSNKKTIFDELKRKKKGQKVQGLNNLKATYFLKLQYLLRVIVQGLDGLNNAQQFFIHFGGPFECKNIKEKVTT